MSVRRLLVLASSFLLLLTATSFVAARGTTSRFWIAVTPVVNEAQAQRIVREYDARGRYDELVLVLGDGSDLATLQQSYPAAQALGPELAGESLFVLALRRNESIQPRPGLRILRQTPRQAIVGLADGVPYDVGDVVPPRAVQLFHEGVTRVPLKRQDPMRSGSTHGGTRAGPPPPDPRVQALVDAVLQANLDSDVNTISNSYLTRRSDQPEGIDAQNDLKARFEALGLATTLFDFDGGADDVIAELPGRLEPDKVVIVGAHYDSFNNAGPRKSAPGADDNASGAAAVLELARVFTTSGQPFRYTIRFCLFAAEEFGLFGSDAYAQSLVDNGTPVVAMLNADMIAYRDSHDALDLDMVDSDTTPWLTDQLINISQLYVPSLPVVRGPLFGGTSDNASFAFRGFPAAFYFEDLDHYSPFIHTKDDTYGNSANDFVLAAQITRAVAAGAAVLADPADLVIDHAPVQDSADSWNPYVVTASVTSVIGTTPTTVELHYDVGLGEQIVAMTGSGTANEWIGQIPAQAAGKMIDYFLVGTDSSGYTERAPTVGNFHFQIGRHDTFFFDDFEAGQGGWTTGGVENDFQIGTPAGKSTDPNAAHSGVNCFGNDLGGPGFNGDYRPNANCRLNSPTIHANGKSHCHLRYARWLGVEDGTYDQAELYVFGKKVWTNPVGDGTDQFIDRAWVMHDLDVSAQADNNPAFQIKYKMVSDGGLEFGGWNIDDVEMYSLQPGVEPELSRDSAYLSLATGGTVHFSIALPPAYANDGYVVLAGMSGTDPGFDANTTHVALNFDLLTSFMLQTIADYPGFVGLTDGAGRAGATLDMPDNVDPSLLGTHLSFVTITLDPTNHATAPVDVLIAE